MFLIWFNNASKETPLKKVAGLSMVKRAVLSAKSAGFTDIIVCIKSSDESFVTKELTDDKRILKSVTIFSDVSSLSSAVDKFNAQKDKNKSNDKNDVVVAMGNIIWTAPAIKALGQLLPKGIDLQIINAAASKQHASGLYRIKTTLLDRLPLSNNISQQELIKSFVQNDNNSSVLQTNMGNCFYKIDEPQDIYDAETVLLQSLKKDADGIISRNINRKISLFLSRKLAKTSIHPHHITLIVFLIGMSSGFWAFFKGGYLGFMLAGLCYYISAILDGCDGEISRLKYLGSSLGAWLDTVVDDMAGLSLILGLYGRLALDAEKPYWLYAGIIAVAFYLLTILPRYYIMAVRLGSGDFQKLAAKQKTKKASGMIKVVEKLRDVIFRTDFIPFYAFVTLALNCPSAFAIPFAIGSVASAVDTFVTLVRPAKDFS